jgi:cholesterol oxidase
MFDFQHCGDVVIASGSGLGGTSLINAGVALRRTTYDDRWPQSLKDPKALNGYYDKVEQTLGVAPYPNIALPAKYRVLQSYARSLGAKIDIAPVAVKFNEGGDGRPACNFCGNCVSGCNRGSKNTLIENYLKLAKNDGAKMYTGVEVRSIERSPDGGWVVWHRPTGSSRKLSGLSARTVVLAAGTLGTTEILLRSRQRGLPLSRQLGQRFSGNGDVIDVAYDGHDLANALGTSSARSTVAGALVGPCITGYAQVTPPDGSPGYLLEEGVIPGGLAALIPAAMALTAYRTLQDSIPLAVKWSRRGRWSTYAFQHSHSKPVRHSMVLLVIGHDDDGGFMHLRGEHMRIDWAGQSDRPIELRRGQLAAATAWAGATFLHKALSPGHNRTPISVHPLGGCIMADDAKNGVVDESCRVFTSGSGTDFHRGLYVADGSVVPGSLGINPLLTIAAVAERAAKQMMDRTEV